MVNRRVVLLAVDAGIIVALYGLIGLLAKLNLSTLRPVKVIGPEMLGLLLVCIFTARYLLGVYRTVWRYAHSASYIRLMLADAAAGIVFLVLGHEVFKSHYIGFAYSAIIGMHILLATMASRFVYQYFYAGQERTADQKAGIAQNKRIPIAIVGAGNVGATLAGELIRNPGARYVPYCFIDNDPTKVGREIRNLRILPEDEYTIEQLRTSPVQEIVIAMPDATPADKSRLYDFYKQANCPVKIYDYPLGDSKDEKMTLRNLRVEDLLFRNVLSIENDKTKAYYQDKVVLVTGGGGSIGSELCRQIADIGPKQLIILDIYENNAYEIQQELIRKHGDALNMEVVIASVRDRARLESLFRNLRPEIVFHAAAHKHVPLMQHSSAEAIKNNVFGTVNVADMAEKYGVKKFLLISTDKAVNPTNVMGASKRLCEMAVQCRADSSTEFTAVRFGNVLGSNGSVIPLFTRQIENGGPITITDKRIIRYFMTIPEAVQLVMEAGAMAKSGELFVLDMGKPVKILDLAENMIRLAGLKPYEDIEIEEIGLRPGEKLYEELLIKSAELEKTANKMIFVEHAMPLTRDEMAEKLRILGEAVENQDAKENTEGDAADPEKYILPAIRQTVPTYKDPDEINSKVDL
ncbi:MAG: nucleoside-diphosphate sugar epimerase/dehydratase [Selenomonadaceae bacterium]|nr:nucleoside-diphosphate sugar epimerase/dehydratase [Selenomonadaceae bacterium]